VAVEELAPLDLQAVLEVAAAAVEAYEQGALVQQDKEMMAAHLHHRAIHREAVVEQVLLV
jgi:hypothetical protein